MTLLLPLVCAVLYACGTYLLLQRTLTRIILGLALLGHGTVLLLQVAGGRAGDVPIVGPDDPTAGVVDPLPHALALTAIVITFGVTAFLLALAYRSWLLTNDDEVQDDLEDARVATSRDDQVGGLMADEVGDLTEFGPDDHGPGEHP